MKLLIICLLLFSRLSAQQLQELEGKAQGTYYIIKYLADDTCSLQSGIDSLFSSIDHSLSLYKPGSLINQFNEKGSVLMDSHMQAVVSKALAVSRLTGGKFDITVKPLVDVWGFGVHRPDRQQQPDPDSLRKALEKVGYRYLQVKGGRLSRLKAGVEIDCNGIAQGYTSDVIARFLEAHQIYNYLVDVGGELCSKGHNQRHQTWTIGIERPALSPDDDPGQAPVQLPGKAMTTSGNSRPSFDAGGQRFGHTIDPISGHALHNNIICVTVIAADAITADAFDNALILMGVEQALIWISAHPALGLDAYFIYKDENGIVRERFSPGFQQLLL